MGVPETVVFFFPSCICVRSCYVCVLVLQVCERCQKISRTHLLQTAVYACPHTRYVASYPIYVSSYSRRASGISGSLSHLHLPPHQVPDTPISSTQNTKKASSSYYVCPLSAFAKKKLEKPRKLKKNGGRHTSLPSQFASTPLLGQCVTSLRLALRPPFKKKS